MSYDQYDPGGLTIEELSNQLMALQSRLASTISEVRREDGELQEKQSQILQDIDTINLSVSALDTRVGAAQASISIQAGQISSKVSVSDFNGNTIASLINQTATTVSILASKINLVGAVTVLSDITGNLGTITSGNIDIQEGIKIGKVIWMGEGFSDTDIKAIYFNNDGIIQTSDTSFYVQSYSKLYLEADTDIIFKGESINFSNIPITGLNVTVNFG